MAMNKETKIGIMMTLVVIGLSILTFQTGNFNFSNEGYDIKVHFRNIDGVNLNSPVMFNGYEMGIVKDIRILETGEDVVMELDLWVDARATLREGASAYVKPLGFMGEKYIGLISKNVGADILESGSIITGTEPQSIDDFLRDGSEIAGDVKGIVSNLNERLENNKDNIDGILSNMNSTMTRLSSFVENADERLNVNKDKIDGLLTNMHDLSINLEEMSEDLKNNPWKLLHKQ